VEEKVGAHVVHAEAIAVGAGMVPSAEAAAAEEKQSTVGLGVHAAVNAVAGHRLPPCHSKPHDLQACAMTREENLLREFHAWLQPLVAGLASFHASQYLPRWPGPAQRQIVGELDLLVRQIIYSGNRPTQFDQS